MPTQFPMACSILVACLATAPQFAPVASVTACIDAGDAALAVTVSVRPAALRLRTGTDCAVVAAEGDAR